MKIAVDAMGGDNAPHAVVAGAVHAAREFGVGIILVGIEQMVQAELKKHPFAKSLPIEVRNATQVVDMLDSPATVFRRKKDSSIRVANDLVKSGEAVAVISAGHTGAAMATSLFVLGKLEGIERPAIATFMPTMKGTSIILDVGANVDCKPNHLLQFAVLGEVYAKYLLKNPNPRIGLLSIGEEATKGNELTKEAFKCAARADLEAMNLSEEERNRVEILAGAIVNKILHDPMTGLKEESREKDALPFVAAIRRLFKL